MMATLATSGGAHAQSPLDREAAEWNAAREAGTVEAYQRYLELYPVGAYAGEAFRAIIELSIDPALGVYRIDPAQPSMVTRGLAVDIY